MNLDMLEDFFLRPPHIFWSPKVTKFSLITPFVENFWMFF